jgi:hypothetical protein
MMKTAHARFPSKTPETKEAYYKSFQNIFDPLGRAVMDSINQVLNLTLAVIKL